MPAAHQGEAWNHQVDFLVVGSGCGGLTAALTADAHGLDTLIIEKGGVYGGSTALSGGNIWVPNNPTLRRVGLADSRADVRSYLDAVVGDRAPAANIDAFIDDGPGAMEFLERTSPHLRFQWCTGYSDYHPEAPRRTRPRTHRRATALRSEKAGRRREAAAARRAGDARRTVRHLKRIRSPEYGHAYLVGPPRGPAHRGAGSQKHCAAASYGHPRSGVDRPTAAGRQGCGHPAVAQHAPAVADH